MTPEFSRYLAKLFQTSVIRALDIDLRSDIADACQPYSSVDQVPNVGYRKILRQADVELQRILRGVQ